MSIQTHRNPWQKDQGKVIIANILLLASGLGIIVKYVLTDSFFFHSQTNREQKVNEIVESLDKFNKLG